MVVRNSVIYLTSSLISKAAPFFLLPLLTKYLTVEEYGLLSIFLVINMLYVACIGMGMSMNVTKNFFKTNKEGMALIIGNVLIVLFFMAFIFLLVTTVFSLNDEVLFSVPVLYLMMLPIMAVLVMINQVYLTVLRCEEKACRYLLVEVSNAVIVFTCTCVLLMQFSQGWLSQVFANAISGFVISIISMVMLYKNGYLVFKINIKTIKEIYLLSIPLVPHVIGIVVINISDRLFIEKMVGLESVGIYSIGYSIGMLVSIVSESIIKAWSPWFFRNIESPDRNFKVKVVNFTYLYLVFLVIVSLFLYLLASFIFPYFIEEEFGGAVDYILPVGFAYCIHGAYRVFHVFVVYVGKTQYLAYSTFFAALVNIALNYYFISLYGVLGAVYSTCVSFLISALIVYFVQRKSFYLPWLYMIRKEI